MHPEGQELGRWRDMVTTVRKSLDYVKNKPRHGYAIDRPGLQVTWGEMYKTLTHLSALLPHMDRDATLLERYFRWVRIPEGIDYTGYYEPTLRASRTKKPGYTHPLYRVPPELAEYERKEQRYFDRETIERKGILKKRGLELAWVSDPVDAFFLAVQGSGWLIFDDGTREHVGYAGRNGHKYKAIGRSMYEQGLIEHINAAAIREWFVRNPDRVQDILHENPNFVFFKFGGYVSTGAMGYGVDEWLSLAVDPSFVPLGAVLAFGVNVPEREGRSPLRGIGFAQDVGSAIKGNRVDVFCGQGQRAAYVASNLDAHGPAWVLLAR